MSITAAVCTMPVRLKARGDVSLVQLLRESGYLDSPGSVTVATVVSHLRQHLDLIDAWLMLSADKRCDSGWYLTEKQGGLLELGYFPTGPRTEFSDRVRGCAEFIVREAASLAEFV